ncbi:alpha/beta hydrolase [Microbaculum marinum]|uniref:Alpha/beta hydrolase n=1 Tax=Microbaculum marinum TaxID=1764581 RepID=A0AAW9S1R9_9HYPH
MPDAVYRGMDADTLAREYDARATVPSIEPFLQRYASLSAEMRATLPCHLDVSYGPSEAEAMDIFPAGPGAPVLVFIHGGYWRLLSKDDSAFMAKAFTDEGIAVAAVDYALAPEASLDEIVRQCRSAVTWLWANGREFGIDPQRIHVAGSSAGGHLVGMLTTPGWHELDGVTEDIVKGAVSASGLYDLEPVRLTTPNEWLRLSPADAARNSPIRHLPAPGSAVGCPLIAVWGGNETAEFKRQSRDYAEAWKSRGFPCTAYEIGDRNHFDIILDLADPKRRLFRDTLAMIAAS